MHQCFHLNSKNSLRFQFYLQNKIPDQNSIQNSNKFVKPVNIYADTHSRVKRLLHKSIITSLAVVFPFSSKSKAQSEEGYVYEDQIDKFSLLIPEGFTILPRKLPKVSFSKYLSEDILLVATNFNEGVSMSVTKTDARRLLKDFNIDWWFDQLATISDLGDSTLLATLLIYQRQDNFDGKTPTAMQILNSKIDQDKDTLYFDFETPVVEGVTRKSMTKAIYRQGFLYVLWINGLNSVFDGDYTTELRRIQASFS